MVWRIGGLGERPQGFRGASTLTSFHVSDMTAKRRPRNGPSPPLPPLCARPSSQLPKVSGRSWPRKTMILAPMATRPPWKVVAPSRPCKWRRLESETEFSGASCGPNLKPLDISGPRWPPKPPDAPTPPPWRQAPFELRAGLQRLATTCSKMAEDTLERRCNNDSANHAKVHILCVCVRTWECPPAMLR